MSMLKVIDPNTGSVVNETATLDEQGLDRQLAAVAKAFDPWKQASMSERAAVLQAVAAELRRRKPRLMELMTREMGKPVKEGGPEVEKAAWCAEHFAEHAEAYLQDEPWPSDASRSYVTFQPLGTLLAILPWNAPVWLALRALAPALMAGNTCAMKHDPHTPGCAAEVAAAFDTVAERFPIARHIVVNLPLDNAQTEKAIRDRRIAAVSFTGSSSAGAKVAAIAGSEIKRTVLELGGSDPFIVLADADLDRAADVACLSRIINAGQSCIAAKRIIIEEAVYEQFAEKVQARLSRLRVGDPADEQTDVGPLARADLRENLHRQVQDSIAAGARCRLGGELPKAGSGFHYPVTLLSEVEPGMAVFAEETFGPVMCLIQARDADHALELANDTEYGLGAAVWSADVRRATALANQIFSGQVSINGIVKTDPRLPSGGVKRSGYGRELGAHGIREFVNAKQIWVG